ncbi:alanine--tRNA ligase-related protein [Salinirubellus salinus]|uniref:Alanine--tRNA ligase-related protein n=1 Tax=Salinirubellus salinus TaxID=1364945 RepID=A0A9E7R9C4_9EURY|nr:alanine--tRNA ligase-related protein [Salinirubellus salinus]UWM56858.1 alanine--tRNA ligase-related protein [Salinirubellus salinus]
MESRASAEPYTLDFDARVESGGESVVLSETYFYPEGGGQPADRGTVAGVEVLDVQSRDGEVVHTLAEPVAEGREVACRVDPEFRRYCQRAHTASHALYGAGRRLFDDLGYAGFGIEADPDRDHATPDPAREKVRVDFETSSEVDDAALVELERLVNRVVWEGREVTWGAVPREDALADASVAFNTKTEEGVAGADSVRVVEIGPATGGDDPWDRAACGGTHVANTREIGPVTVLGRSNPGEGRTRVEFAVGPAGIERRASERRAAYDAARGLGVAVTDLPEAVERARERREALETEVADLESRLVAARVAALRSETVARDGAEWLVGHVALDANALMEQARSLAGDAANVVALVGDGSLAVATDGVVDAGDVADRVTDEFGGGGGGSPTAAQAGGFDADPDTVVAFLRD